MPFTPCVVTVKHTGCNVVMAVAVNSRGYLDLIPDDSFYRKSTIVDLRLNVFYNDASSSLRSLQADSPSLSDAKPAFKEDATTLSCVCLESQNGKEKIQSSIDRFLTMS
jgi:hypothetical protein